MPTTRSSSKRQAHLDEFVESKSSAATDPSPKRAGASSSPQRRSDTRHERSQQTESAQPRKKQKRQQSPDKISGPRENSLLINRAPVLQLWAAEVAQFMHPELSWPACLSIGSAISSLCAVSKGRAIGMIEPKKEEEKQDDGSEERQETKRVVKQQSEPVIVMGFSLHLKNDAVLMNGKPKSLNESTLKSKFGAENYESVKTAMSANLESWSDKKDMLDKQAFHMYEDFRPSVAPGQKGWGRKGELNLDRIASVIERALE